MIPRRSELLSIPSSRKDLIYLESDKKQFAQSKQKIHFIAYDEEAAMLQICFSGPPSTTFEEQGRLQTEIDYIVNGEAAERTYFTTHGMYWRQYTSILIHNVKTLKSLELHCTEERIAVTIPKDTPS